jgi:protein TonB
MERSPSSPRLVRPAPRDGRLPLQERNRRRRQAAGERIARQIRRPLTAAQRIFDPLTRGRRPGGRIGRAAAALLASAAVHGAVVALGLVIGRSEVGKREVIHQEVKVEVRERPAPPPPEPPPEKPAPPPPQVKIARVPPPPKAPPPEPVKGPPPRVVGLSLESTSEGGEGPAFAVGNTRAGTTAEKAEAPKDVPPAPPAETAPSPSPNQVASRIPTTGITYTMPKRRSPSKPPYPETLKAQGIEADVPVMVHIDADGKVTSVKVVKPSPYPEFNESARRAAAAEEFEPATRDGVPIPYTLSFTYRFRLEEE